MYDPAKSQQLPERFVQEGLRLAKGSLLFGIPMEDLSRDELLAATAQGWELYRRALEGSLLKGTFNV